MMTMFWPGARPCSAGAPSRGTSAWTCRCTPDVPSLRRNWRLHPPRCPFRPGCCHRCHRCSNGCRVCSKAAASVNPGRACPCCWTGSACICLASGAMSIRWRRRFGSAQFRSKGLIWRRCEAVWTVFSLQLHRRPTVWTGRSWPRHWPPVTALPSSPADREPARPRPWSRCWRCCWNRIRNWTSAWLLPPARPRPA